MTCREFKHAASSLTLWELSRPNDKQVLDHAEECPKCGAWLDWQQMLAVSMQTLQAQTVYREAGPHVERALLGVFRQEACKTTRHTVAFRSAPIAFRLSRLFEAGAYVAVAAAIIVGLFLGVRLLERRSATGNIASQPTPVVAAAVQSAGNATRQNVAPARQERREMAVTREVAAQPVFQGNRTRNSSGAASPSTSDPDYVALMFCDPLICSSDAQVVRMELPVAGASQPEAQTQVADVVVGDDGLVRAVRIVN